MFDFCLIFVSFSTLSFARSFQEWKERVDTVPAIRASLDDTFYNNVMGQTAAMVEMGLQSSNNEYTKRLYNGEIPILCSIIDKEDRQFQMCFEIQNNIAVNACLMTNDDYVFYCVR